MTGGRLRDGYITRLIVPLWLFLFTVTMKEKIFAKMAPVEIGAYSNAIKCGNIIFVSGQLPVNPETGKVPPTIQEQTKQVIANIRNILADAGATLDDVVKTTVYLQEMYLFSQMNEVYASEFNEPYPARTSLAAKEMAQGSLVSIDVIAVLTNHVNLQRSH